MNSIDILTASEVATLLQTNTRTVKRLVTQKRLEASVISGKWYFTQASIQKMLDDSRI